MKEDTEKENSGGGIWTMIDRIQGDKVIWIIVILLILYSTVAIFSSSPLKANELGVDRWDVFMDHMTGVLAGVVCIFLFYFFGRIGIIRFFSQLCFIGSMVLLVMLLGSDNLRALQIGRASIQPFEFVKVGMVLYLSWAVQAYKTDSFLIINKLSRISWLRWLDKPWIKRVIYIYIPIVLVTVCIMTRGFSSAVFTAIIMIATVLIGGVPKKDILFVTVFVVVMVALSFGLWKATNWEWLGRRWETVEGRIERFIHPQEITDFEPGTKEYKDYLDNLRQPEGAKIAVKEGGLLGKGPGHSRQRYSIADMYDDYIFCFIIEEYGILLGAIPLIILYLSLVARGSIIARSCTQEFSKTVVAGLVLLISGQAMMHMYVNASLGPITGQVLPLVSYGKSSFVAFSIAFGILLSISKTVKQQVEQVQNDAAPIVERSDDEVQDALNDLDDFEASI